MTLSTTTKLRSALFTALATAGVVGVVACGGGGESSSLSDAGKGDATTVDGGKVSGPEAGPADTGTFDGGADATDGATGQSGDASTPIVCTQTISSDLDGAIAKAQGGETLCLASGSYPNLTLNNQNTASAITITAAPGATVSMDGVYLLSSGHLTFEGIAFTSSCVVRDSPQDSATTFDADTFIDITPGSTDYEGRITVTSDTDVGMNGVVIRNCLMKGGLSDGIQVDGDAHGTLIENNEITGIIQSGAPSSPHSDGIQMVGSIGTQIIGNYIHDNSDGILSDDGNDSFTISGNVIVGVESRALEFGGGTNNTVTHNVFGGIVNFGDDHDGDHTTNLILRDNVMPDISVNAGIPAWGTESYNLVGDGSSGAHDISGSPTFVGGDKPTTMSGYHLAVGSLGVGKASDGTNIGIP